MRWLAILALVGASCGSGMADAGESAPERGGLLVLELFTSQGCSSCPPADRLLAELGERDDVAALAFHVDYWNDLGWADPFSSPRWSERQRSYGTRVYTPMLMINGRQDVVGSRRRAVSAALERAEPLPALELAVRRDGDTLRIDTDPTATVALTESGITTRVQKGENAGRTLSNDHIVRALVRGGEPIRIDPAWTGELRVIAFTRDRAATTRIE